MALRKQPVPDMGKTYNQFVKIILKEEEGEKKLGTPTSCWSHQEHKELVEIDVGLQRPLPKFRAAYEETQQVGWAPAPFTQ